MERTTYDLLDEPVGELYYGLLDFALSECTLALLVQYPRSELSESGQDIMRQFARFLHSTERSHEWPGTTSGWRATLYYYEYSPDCADLLRLLTNRLYAWDRWYLPNDLCLLREDRSPWLVTIGHENDGYLELTDEEKARLVVGFPPIAPYLRDARDRGLAHDEEMEVGAFLCAWDPYQRFTDPSKDLVPQCQAIRFVLATGRAGDEGELAAHIAGMYTRWLPDWPSVAPDEAASVAHTIWEWWEERRRA